MTQTGSIRAKGVRSSLLAMFRAAAETAAQDPTASGCARLQIAELAMRGAMAAAHINACDACRAEHLAIRAALSCFVAAGEPSTKPPMRPAKRELRLIQGGRPSPAPYPSASNSSIISAIIDSPMSQNPGSRASRPNGLSSSPYGFDPPASNSAK